MTADLPGWALRPFRLVRNDRTRQEQRPETPQGQARHGFRAPEQKC